jgi:hypothetical protein
MAPWPDLEDLTTSVSKADPGLEAFGARSVVAMCDKPDAMGVSRVFEIDATGGLEFGLQHLRGYEFSATKRLF